MSTFRILKRSAIIASAAALPTLLTAESWPMYHGPQGGRITSEAVSAPTIKAGHVLWETEVQTGFSSFCVADGKAFTLVTRDIEGNPTETLVAYDSNTGTELWQAGLTYIKYAGGGNSGAKGNNGGNGPMSTPSADGGRVFVYDAKLGLHAFDATTGKALWKHDILKEYNGREIKWNNAVSPLLHDDMVIVPGGGRGESLLAFKANDGTLAWKSGDESPTHATPVVASIHGTTQVIFFCQSGLVSVDPRDGAELWKQAFDFKTSTAASPIIDGDLVYCSAGYGVGAGLYRISKTGSSFQSEEVWRMVGENVNHWSTPVLHEGHLYGMFSFKKYGDGPLACVELETGKQKWAEQGFGPGNLIMAGDQLLVLGDSGQLVVVDPNPGSYQEAARFQALEGKCWTSPVVADGKVYIRSTSEAKCLKAR